MLRTFDFVTGRMNQIEKSQPSFLNQVIYALVRIFNQSIVLVRLPRYRIMKLLFFDCQKKWFLKKKGVVERVHRCPSQVMTALGRRTFGYT